MEKYLPSALIALVVVGALICIENSNRAAAARAVEYKVVTMHDLFGLDLAIIELGGLTPLSTGQSGPTEAALQKLSNDGWELVGVSNGVFYFKRPAS